MPGEPRNRSGRKPKAATPANRSDLPGQAWTEPPPHAGQDWPTPAGVVAKGHTARTGAANQLKKDSTMTTDLQTIYARARTYKDAVLRQWVDNLSHMAINDEGARPEALRRIAFIEVELLGTARAA